LDLVVELVAQVQWVGLARLEFEVRLALPDSLEVRVPPASEDRRDSVDLMVILEQPDQVVIREAPGLQVSVVIRDKLVYLEEPDQEDCLVCLEVLECVEMKVNLARLADLEEQVLCCIEQFNVLI